MNLNGRLRKLEQANLANPLRPRTAQDLSDGELAAIIRAGARDDELTDEDLKIVIALENQT